jgi:hypothetical protein
MSWGSGDEANAGGVLWTSDPHTDRWRMPCGCRATFDSDERPICGRVGFGPDIDPERYRAPAGGCEVCGGTGVLIGRPDKNLHAGGRVGLWHDGKWRDWTQFDESVDRRVGPDWATTPKGRDADIRRRHEAGESQKHIADIYEVDRSTISRIVNENHQRPLGRYGDRWHVKRPTQAEYDRIARELSDLLDERDARLQRIRDREEPAYSSLTHDYFWNGKRFVSVAK